jgi:hypothetical protein
MIRQSAMSETMQIILIGLAILGFIFFQSGLWNRMETKLSFQKTPASQPGPGAESRDIQTAYNQPGPSSVFSQSQ